MSYFLGATGFLGSLVLILMLQPHCEALYQLMTECPKPGESTDAGVCANLCTTIADCGPKSFCCPNACGGTQCTVVMASCWEDDKEYEHHNWMPLDSSSDTDECGFCWCQNGRKACHRYPCEGPMP